MSFDNSIYSELAVPKISTCSQHKQQIGVQAVRKLINLINQLPEESCILPWQIVEKDSVRVIME